MLPIFLLILSLTYSSPLGVSGRSPTRPFVGIYGGHNASITDYPYQVAIFEDDTFSCGGSILNEKFILSAAHCFYLGTFNTTVRAGSSYQDTAGQVVIVKNVTSHPDFTLTTIDNDIAVLELESPLSFGEGVQPIMLPPKDSSFHDNDTSLVTGWGIIDRDHYAAVLQVVSLPLYTTETCRKFYGDGLTDNMICAGGVVGEGTCSGDSGGPLVANGVQVGIVSFGSGCAVARPSVFTKVSQYLSFIGNIIHSNQPK